MLKEKFPDLFLRLKENLAYYAGESVLGENELNPKHHIQTVLRLGALELLANIYSGRITASDKDPFPHQLALQQYVKNHESRIKRILIASPIMRSPTLLSSWAVTEKPVVDIKFIARSQFRFGELYLAKHINRLLCIFTLSPH